MADSQPFPPAQRKKILRVLFFSLLLDLISFTFILPLFPKLLEFYRNLEATSSLTSTSTSPTLLTRILHLLNTYKLSFARPISPHHDIVLLGGALGSLFSLCQALASPLIGRLSDTHGRRTALLWSMMGNILSVALWVAAVDFRTFLASRIVGGLSEGNVQLATAIAADISSEEQRGATMAMVGACFSVAFTFGPALGAALAGMRVVKGNPFATAAGFSLVLIVAETLYLYFCLPETLPSAVEKEGGKVNGSAAATATENGKSTSTTTDTKTDTATSPIPHRRTNTHTSLNTTHFLFILFFSGLEFSLSFLSSDLFAYTSPQQGRLLGFIGLVASILQGGVTRRIHPLRAVQMGVVSCAVAFAMLGRVSTERGLYVAAASLAVTSATVVTGLNGLASFEAGVGERGRVMGWHRSFGQIGRTLGPLIFCSLYWWAGREVAYNVGLAGMLAVATIVFGVLRIPPGTERKKKGKKVGEEVKAA